MGIKQDTRVFLSGIQRKKLGKHELLGKQEKLIQRGGLVKWLWSGPWIPAAEAGDALDLGNSSVQAFLVANLDFLTMM